MNNILDVDGPLITFLSKAGQCILLSMIWILTSIPIVTIGTSSAALYYAVVKSIKKNRGYPVKEYFRAWKRNFLRGTAFSIVILLLAGLMVYNREVITDTAADTSFEGGMLSAYVIYDGILLLLAMLSLYLFPVLSRFSMKASDLVKLSFLLSVKYIYYTVPLLCGVVALIVLQIRILPMWTVVILPAAWVYVSSVWIEKAMRKYYPGPKEGEDAWWLE